MRSRDTLLRLHRFRTQEKRRQAADIDSMIQDFMRKYDDLDAQVKLEEGRNGVSDPNHFNYSLSAKAARGRRDNLMRSIAELRDQLADAQGQLAEEEQELRRVELLVEKETGTAALPPQSVQPATGAHAR
ncbi:flagellar export protein FliJ [Aestuariivirga sp.]|uniref:flagellar export protein FliJ n=1 Tax=Aestuariivirga sp. TaxID=2650926 RepID=UPI0039E3A6D1